MRSTVIALPVLAVAALVGCDASTFQYEGALHTETRGVVLHADGETGQAGMFESTCVVYPDGGVGSDIDYPGSDDELQDATVQFGEQVVLVRSELGVHVQSAFGDLGGFSAGGSVDVPGALEGRFTDDGVVTLAQGGQGCEVSWHDDDPATVDVPAALCGGDFTVDPVTGTAYGTAGGDVVQVTPDGAEVVGQGELVAFDATAEVLYTAEQGGIEVRALEADGAVRWSVELAGAVSSLSDMGVRGAAVVSTRAYSGIGRLYVIDGFTGEILEERATPEPGQELTASDDGRRIAVVLPGAVHFLQAP